MKTLILCGGRGTRAYPHTIELPKPLLEVAGRPVLAHVMDIYAAQGFTSFVLAAGFRADLIVSFARTLPEDWQVDVVDTGEDTDTGERVLRCHDHVGELFFATYADGLSDIDLHALRQFHDAHPGAATLTTVPLPSQYGTIETGLRGRVERFCEKPVLADRWINAGYFVLDSRAFGTWTGTDLEREVLPGLSTAGELFAFRHTGFWKSMDTYKDSLELAALCAGGAPPWTRSPAPASW